MERKLTREVKIGSLKMGGTNPIIIQSMCNTDTRDVEATVAQILALEKAGCELVRVAIPDMAAADAVGEIKKRIHIPLVADIHFDYKLAIAAAEGGAAKIRINPGNIGGEDRGQGRSTHQAGSRYGEGKTDSHSHRCKQRLSGKGIGGKI